MTAERLDERVHAATYIEMVGMVMAGHHAHPWNTRQFFRADGIAELDGHALARLLAQLLYLLDGDEFALVEAAGKKAIVKINDVGPLTPGRIIDLNERAMRYFDPSLNRGVIANVKVEPLFGYSWTPGPVG